ncbi:MAG: thiamine-phosphate synthase family protein [Thermoprotei archaeon]
MYPFLSLIIYISLVMSDEKVKVLRDLKEAADLFVGYERAAELIPEIRTNLVYALPNAKTTSEVAGIPGRITAAFGRAFYCMEPAFGASDHMARLVVSAMKYSPELRSAINVRLFGVPEGAYVFDRSKEPEESRKVERGTMQTIVEAAHKDLGRVPEVIVDSGDFGKEPGIYVLGTNPVNVVKRVIELYEKYTNSRP